MLISKLLPIPALKILIPDDCSTLRPLLSELHQIHSEAARPGKPLPLPPSPPKLPGMGVLARYLRHGHGIMGIRYGYHCLLAKPGTQAETLLRGQRKGAEDVEGIPEARAQYALNILQDRLELLIAELERGGVVAVEEDEENDIDEQESQTQSLIAALTGEPTLSLDEVQERHTLLIDTLSTSRILLNATAAFDLVRSPTEAAHIKASLRPNHLTIIALDNFIRHLPHFETLGQPFSEIHYLHLNVKQPIAPWTPCAKIVKLFCPEEVRKATTK